MSLTPQIIQAQVKQLKKRLIASPAGRLANDLSLCLRESPGGGPAGEQNEALIIGIHSSFAWDGPPEVEVEGERFWVRSCTSQLGARELLVSEKPEGVGLVIVTPLAEQDLGEDVLARLARGRLETKSLTLVLKDALKAEKIEPGLHKCPDLVQAALGVLVGSGMGESQESAPDGLVTANLLWEILIEKCLNLTTRGPNLSDLLSWSFSSGGVTQPAGVSAYLSFTPELRAGLVEHLRVECGIAQSAAVFKLLEERGATWPLVIGLVLEALAQMPDGREERELWVRLERFVGRNHETSGSTERLWAREWGDAALEVIGSLFQGEQLTVVIGLVQQADKLLADELHAKELFLHSSWSEKGWSANLSLVGELIEEGLGCLDEHSGACSAGSRFTVVQNKLAPVLKHLNNHLFVRHDLKGSAARYHRLLMAVRLLRFLAYENNWIGRSSPAGIGASNKSLSSIADAYLQEGSFVDWARGEISQGDAEARLQRALRALSSQVGELRAGENREFALALQSELALAQPNGPSGALAGSLVSIENITAQLVAPLAKAQGAVLLLVLDGLSLAVFRELAEDFPRHGFELAEFKEKGQEAFRGRSLVGLALLPSITEVSRRALFAGRIVQNLPTSEENLFAENGALSAVCKRNLPPVLFSKDRLCQAPFKTLSPEVREAILAPERKIVGCIINAVDDNLQKGGQQSEQWSVERIGPLGELLELAAHARRTVIITADHGHVIERDSELRRYDAGERYRTPESIAKGKGTAELVSDGELLFSGERVVQPGNKVICPWQENVRYTPTRKHGYHGGASLQEMLVPLAVLLPRAEAEGLDVSEAGRGDEGVQLNLLPSGEPNWWAIASPLVGSIDTLPAMAEQATVVQGLELADKPSANTPLPSAMPARLRGKALTQAQIMPEQLSLGAVIPENRKPATAESEILFQQLIASVVFQRQLAVVGRSAPPESRQREFLELMQSRGGKVLKASLAQKLNITSFHVDGFLASMRRILNVDGFQVLSCKEPSGDVELNVELLCQQFSLLKKKHEPSNNGLKEKIDD